MVLVGGEHFPLAGLHDAVAVRVHFSERLAHPVLVPEVGDELISKDAAVAILVNFKELLLARSTVAGLRGSLLLLGHFFFLLDL